MRSKRGRRASSTFLHLDCVADSIRIDPLSRPPQKAFWGEEKTRCSVIPFPVNLIDIDPATGEVVIRRHLESSGAVVSERFRYGWMIRIIHLENDLISIGFEIEKNHGVVDGQLGKSNDMNHQEVAAGEVLSERICNTGLLPAAERKDHSPVAALKITLPSAAAILFQQILVRLAEFAQVCIAGDYNL